MMREGEGINREARIDMIIGKMYDKIKIAMKTSDDSKAVEYLTNFCGFFENQPGVKIPEPDSIEYWQAAENFLDQLIELQTFEEGLGNRPDEEIN